jgi:hypothetical protein
LLYGSKRSLWSRRVRGHGDFEDFPPSSPIGMPTLLEAMGVLDLLANVGLARRRERRELRGASRLLTREMNRAALSLRFALGENSWGSLDWDALRLTSWAASSQLLAEGLRPHNWAVVEAAARTSADLLAMRGIDRRIFPNADGGPPDADRYELLSAATELEDAVLALESVSGWSDPANGIRLTRELMVETDEPWAVGGQHVVG